MKKNLLLPVVAIIVAVLAVLIGLAANAQTRAGFAHPQGVERAMDNSPALARAAIESACTQEQLDVIEAALLPPLTDDEKRVALETAEKLLLDAGAAELAVAVRTEIDKPKEPPLGEIPVQGAK